ncbi:MAG: hypothetical protein HKN81_12550, partial [Gammaproteobacteria bacterium]|nr:hypothetical protein [Gammaproteobacteria bacterium]
MQELVSESLGIVGEELTVTLNDVRATLEQYAEGGGGSRSIEKCIDLLHAASGALRVTETYGASLLAEEMEGTCRHLSKMRPDDARAEEALEALSRAAVQLPSYVDLIISGGRDIPLVLLPLLNDLRAARGRPLLSESTLLLLNIGTTGAQRAELDGRGGSGERIEDLCRRLRPGFQLALLGWIRGDNTSGNLAKIGEIAERLELAATTPEVHQLWWVIGGVVEALLENGLETSVSLKRLMGQADREMKRLPTIGETDYTAKPPTELINNLLYYIARSTTAGKRVAAIRAAFNLSDLIPGDDQVEEARESLAAPSPRLMTTVAAAIRDDLARVKDVLDIYVRTGMEHVEELTPQIELLKKIGDTLGVLGLGDLRETIQQKRGDLQDIIDSGQPVEEAVLLDMAAALLYVEDHLDEKLFGLIRPAEAGEHDEQEPSADSEFDQVAQAVMRECVVNLARVKDAVALVLERPNEASLLDGVPGYLRGITAGLIILEKENAVSVVDEIGEFIGEMIEQGYAGVGSAELDLLADAVVSLEYYLETLQNGRKEPVYMLDNARSCLSALREAGPEVAPGIPDDKDRSGMSTTMQLPDLESTQIAAGTQVIPGAAVMSADGEERVDPELIELFIEEAGEEIDAITAAFPQWEQDESREDLLIQIRRSFHTLKGSGRMVGADLIGDFCWRFEDLLNRLINGTLPLDAAVVDCTRRAVEALPELLEKLEVGAEPQVDIDGLMREAESLAESKPGAAAADESFESEETMIVPPEELAELGLELPSTSEEETASVEIDPALMEILSKETGGHLEVILDFVQAAADGIPPFPVTEELHRACHTLHGSVTMAQASPAAAVTGPLNQMIRRAFDHDVPLERDALTVCADAVEAIAEIISGIDRGDSAMPDTGDLQANLLVIDTQIEEAAAIAEAQSEESIPPGVLIDDEDLDLVDTGESAEEIPVAEEPGEPEPEPEPEPETEETEPVAEEPVHPDFDPEIAAIFSEEAVEILEAIDTEMSHAMDKQLGENSLAELQRHLHTLKGGARLAGLMAMGDLSHDLETLLVRLAGGSLEQTEARFDVLRSTVDELHRMSDEVGEGRAALPPQALTERLGASLEDRPWEAAEQVEEEILAAEPTAETAAAGEVEFEEQAAEPEPPAEEIVEDVVEEGAEEPVAEAADEWAEPEPAEYEEPLEEEPLEKEPEVRVPSIPVSEQLVELARELEQPPVPETRDLSELVQRQPVIPPTRERREVARVDPALLENLLNNAGEVSIFHSRLTQQMGRVQFNLEELGQTVVRLREQLRGLENATEAQIIYQHQASQTGDEEVDPLTLERYSKIQQLSRSLAET